MAYEDWTNVAWVETDPNTDITKAANELNIATMRGDSGASLRNDKGAAHFGDFTHLIETTATAGFDNQGVGYFWALSNVLADGYWWRDNNSQAVGVFWFDDTERMILRDNEDGIGDQEISVNLALTTRYFCTAVRVGVNLDIEIRTGSHAGVLVDTLSVTLTGGRTYRYIYSVNAYSHSGAADVSYDVFNLDLQEAGAAIMNQVQATNLGADLFDGALLGGG